MPFEFELPDLDLLFPAVFGALAVAVLAYSFWPRSATHRRFWVERWATENLVALTPDIAAVVDRELTRRRRIIGAVVPAVLALTVALMAADDGFGEQAVQPWTLVIASGIAISLAFGAELSRPWFPAGPTRMARPRAVVLSDYVPWPLRWGAWISGAYCLALLVIIVATATTPSQALWLGGPAFGVLLALGLAEWNGRRAAASPQPARDANELYAQDAWRTGIARCGFQGIALWGGISGLYLQDNLRIPALAEGILRLSGMGLLVLSFVVLLLPTNAMEWTRRRLWPELGPGEFGVAGASAR